MMSRSYRQPGSLPSLTGMVSRIGVGLRIAGLACLLAATGSAALAEDMAAKRAQLTELAEMLADTPQYWAEVPPLEDLAGTWGLSTRDCENADEVAFRILQLEAEALRVDDLMCTFTKTDRHESGLTVIVEADCTSDEGDEADVFMLTMIPDGQISIFEGRSGTNYLRCE